jgi:hypothetical protein
MATSKTDVKAAIEIYINNNNRPCPAVYLTDKFGDDVVEVINIMKKDGDIVGRRGRNGGIAFPDSVFEKKSKNSTSKKIVATPIIEDDDNILASNAQEIEDLEQAEEILNNLSEYSEDYSEDEDNEDMDDDAIAAEEYARIMESMGDN